MEERLKENSCISNSGFDITPFIKGFIDDDKRNIVKENKEEFKHYLLTGRIPLSEQNKNNPQATWCASYAEGYGLAHTCLYQRKI